MTASAYFPRAEEIASEYKGAKITRIDNYCGRTGPLGKALRITVPRVNDVKCPIKRLQHPLLSELRTAYPRDYHHHGCLRVKIDDESIVYLSYKTFVLHLSS